jgi:hypothetical protein
MAATGDGTGGLTITSTAAYQYIFRSNVAGGTHGSMVRVYTVQPKGEDAVVRTTYENGDVRIGGVANGEILPLGTTQNNGKIKSVEAKGETGTGIPIYGIVVVP